MEELPVEIWDLIIDECIPDHLNLRLVCRLFHDIIYRRAVHAGEFELYVERGDKVSILRLWKFLPNIIGRHTTDLIWRYSDDLWLMLLIIECSESLELSHIISLFTLKNKKIIQKITVRYTDKFFGTLRTHRDIIKRFDTLFRWYDPDISCLIHQFKLALLNTTVKYDVFIYAKRAFRKGANNYDIALPRALTNDNKSWFMDIADKYDHDIIREYIFDHESEIDCAQWYLDYLTDGKIACRPLSQDIWYEIGKYCREWHHVLRLVSHDVQSAISRLITPILTDSQLNIACESGYMLDIMNTTSNLNWKTGASEASKNDQYIQ